MGRFKLTRISAKSTSLYQGQKSGNLLRSTLGSSKMDISSTFFLLWVKLMSLLKSHNINYLIMLISFEEATFAMNSGSIDNSFGNNGTWDSINGSEMEIVLS